MTETWSEHKLLSELKAAIEVDIADSDGGRFTESASSEALSAHLDALRATEKPRLLQVLLNAPRGEPLDLSRDRQDEGAI
jgi:hypothetical protein